MSSTEGWKLKLKKTDMTLRQAVELVRKETGVTPYGDLSDEENVLDYIYNEGNGICFLVDGVIWEVVEKKSFDYNGFADVVKDDDGCVNITTVFYNGGTGLGEIVEGCLENINV